MAQCTRCMRKYYRTWSKEHNINNIETLAEYYNVKYNDIKRYKLLKGYVKAVDRVLGQTSTKHKDMRLGTTLEQLKDTIANPISISEPSFISMKKNGSVYLDKRVKFTGKSCSFVYSITDKLLIQATSFGGG